MGNYFGKYRARVTDINDPEERGRVRVECPKVLGSATSAWCEPCFSVAIDSDGDFCLPKKGETIWVEFEEGDWNKPIWSGNWWSAKKTLVEDYTKADSIRIVSFMGSTITMKQGLLILQVGDTSLEITPNGITCKGAITEIDSIFNVNGKSTLTGGIDSVGDLSVEGNVDTDGNTSVSGNSNISGILMLSGKNMNTHTHQYTWTDSGGSGSTQPPQ